MQRNYQIIRLNLTPMVAKKSTKGKLRVTHNVVLGVGCLAACPKQPSPLVGFDRFCGNECSRNPEIYNLLLRGH